MHRLLPFALLLASCTPTTFTFTPTTRGVTAKPSNCVVEVMTSPPARDYQELGTLEFYNGKEPKTLDAFKKAVAKDVCVNGGDAAIAIADLKGQFTKGTVIAYMGSGDAPVKADVPPPQQSDDEMPK